MFFCFYCYFHSVIVLVGWWFVIVEWLRVPVNISYDFAVPSAINSIAIVFLCLSKTGIQYK